MYNISSIILQLATLKAGPMRTVRILKKFKEQQYSSLKLLNCYYFPCISLIGSYTRNFIQEVRHLHTLAARKFCIKDASTAQFISCWLDMVTILIMIVKAGVIILLYLLRSTLQSSPGESNQGTFHLIIKLL